VPGFSGRAVEGWYPLSKVAPLRSAYRKDARSTSIAPWKPGVRQNRVVEGGPREVGTLEEGTAQPCFVETGCRPVGRRRSLRRWVSRPRALPLQVCAPGIGSTRSACIRSHTATRATRKSGRNVSASLSRFLRRNASRRIDRRKRRVNQRKMRSGRRDSNPRPSAWKRAQTGRRGSSRESNPCATQGFPAWGSRRFPSFPRPVRDQSTLSLGSSHGEGRLKHIRGWPGRRCRSAGQHRRCGVVAGRAILGG
jgi:hypothetical protein